MVYVLCLLQNFSRFSASSDRLGNSTPHDSATMYYFFKIYRNPAGLTIEPYVEMGMPKIYCVQIRTSEIEISLILHRIRILGLN